MAAGTGHCWIVGLAVACVNDADKHHHNRRAHHRRKTACGSLRNSAQLFLTALSLRSGAGRLGLGAGAVMAGQRVSTTRAARSSSAARWGLVNAAYFSRLFKATYGLPPREYRVRALS